LDPALYARGFLDTWLVGVGLVGMTVKESHGDLA
jgi:hypothetical protein